MNGEPGKASEALHWMAVAPDGVVHVAWLDHREAGVNKLYYRRVTSGELLPEQKITEAVCECCAPGLAVDTAGRHVKEFEPPGRRCFIPSGFAVHYKGPLDMRHT